MQGRRLVTIGAGVALLTGMLIGGVSGASPASTHTARSGLLPRGAHISAVVRPEARGAVARGNAPQATCTTPGGGNYKADCNSSGSPTNETTIANNGTTFVAGANDYNSYNGNADLGYYTSTNAKTWTDNAPLDLYAHGTNHAAGDPGLAIDTAGVVYYSGIYFDYFDCTIGGVELARRDPGTGAWTNYQIKANTNNEFQDKPAIMQDGTHVFVSWTQYGGCFGASGPSPIKIAAFNGGSASVPPIKILSAPGSLYSQGSAMASDGHGGFWITWEEFPSFTSTIGSIMLAHYRIGAGWTAPQTISPPGFTDLPSPLPGFVFRDNSFPAITVAAGKPKVVWTSYDTGMGRCYLWSNGSVTTISNTGGDQFFPAVATDSNGALAISYSQTNQANSSYDRYQSYLGTVSKVSTASSFPNSDPFFGGSFIGDYEAITTLGTTPHPIWTDLRGPSFAQNAMVYSP
jgi:hypothetical protein